MDKFTTPMILSAVIGMTCMILLCIIAAIALFVPTAGASPLAANLLTNLNTILVSTMGGAFGCLYTLFQKETGVTLPTVPSGSTATETTQVVSRQTVETPATTAVPEIPPKGAA